MSHDALITQLAKQNAPVMPVSRLRLSAEISAVTALLTALVALTYGLRPDMGVMLTQITFIIEMVLNLTLIGLAVLLAVQLSYPDSKGQSFIWQLTALVMVAYGVVLYVQNVASPGAAPDSHGVECVLCILSFTLLPAAWLLWRLRRMAPTQLAQLGMAIFFMAAATGALGVRIVEYGHDSSGVVISHYVPMLALALLGAALGKKIFHW